MSVGEGSLSGIHAASFCYYKAQPQPITASTRLRFASPKLLPSVATSYIRETLCEIPANQEENTYCRCV